MKLLDKALACVLVGAGILAPGCAQPRGYGHPSSGLSGGMAGHRGVTVTGAAEVKATPDMARANLGVEVRAPEAEQATAQANQQMAAVIAALKEAGVAEADIRTHSFSVSFERDDQPPVPVPMEAAPTRVAPKGERSAAQAVEPSKPAQPAGVYRVSNMVEVTLRDLDRAPQVLGAASRAGANQFWGISLELSDPEPRVAEAREKAVAKAQASAEQLAKLTGVKLGPIVNIQDGAESHGPVGPMMAMRAEAASDAVPIERGEITIRHQVQLTYGLPQRPGGKAQD